MLQIWYHIKATLQRVYLNNCVNVATKNAGYATDDTVRDNTMKLKSCKFVILQIQREKIGKRGNIKNKTKQNKTKQNKTKQNKTKQNKTKQNKTKQNKTKQNKTKTKQKQNKTKNKHKTGWQLGPVAEN